MEKLKKSICLLVVMLFVSWQFAYTQPMPAEPKTIDSLIQLLPNTPEDTNRVMNLRLLAQMTMLNNIDQALKYVQEGYLLAQKLDFKKGEILCMQSMAYIYGITGEWVKGTELCYKGISLSAKYEPLHELTFHTLMSLFLQGQNEDAKSLRLLLQVRNHPLFSL